MSGLNPPKINFNTAKAITDSILGSVLNKRLHDEGFPSYINYSFLETAKATNSIVLSRLPGVVGVDLIEQGYDLKGFHIKAKSCNWGPMQGFICQLPIFNKQGTARIGYNAKEITHYLVRLESFEGARAKIGVAKAALDVDLESISDLLTPAQQKVFADDYKKKYDKAVLDVLMEERVKEEKGGEWSGENALEGASPFIPLKRKFDVTALNKLRGVKSSVKLDDTTYYGIAENVTDEASEEKNKPTVITEFLLKKDTEGDLWQIYHGRIKYKTGNSITDAYDNVYTGQTIVDKVDLKVLAKNAVKLATIFAFDNIQALTFDSPGDLEKMRYEDDSRRIIFGAPADGRITFHRVRGFVNPFPPFSSPAEYYRNAVSGDYDLFAIWPHENVGYNELIRQSEYVTGRFNRMGGKIFTTAVGSSNNFAIEFVPHFNQLNPEKDSEHDVLKESADFGNMNSLCHLVSGFLNNFAGTFISDPNIPENERIYSTANKGFHSDEGGRPGITEIEFPIAVYMPFPFLTRALNNFDHATEIPPIVGRKEISTRAGLIKSPEEMVLFIMECMSKDYRVFMHYRWMIHLLYNTLDNNAAAKKELLDGIITENLANIKKLNKDFNITDDNLKEFAAIDENQAQIDARTIPNQANYISNLRKVIRFDKEEDEASFIKIRNLFFAFFFMPGIFSQDKRRMFEEILTASDKRLS